MPGTGIVGTNDHNSVRYSYTDNDKDSVYGSVGGEDLRSFTDTVLGVDLPDSLRNNALTEKAKDAVACDFIRRKTMEGGRQ